MLPLRNEIKKTRFLYRFIDSSLPDLACMLKTILNPGITMLNRGCEKLGFEAFPISSTAYRCLKWMSLMPICLLSVSQPFKNLKKHVPTYLFMSKDQLLQKLCGVDDKPKKIV